MGRQTLRSQPRLWLAIATLLLAFNMRSTLVAVAPVMDQIRAEYVISAAGAALLTGLPVLCFGALAPLAPALSRRVGTKTVLYYCAALIGLGGLLRVVPGLPALLAGTLLLGGATALANVLLPGLVKHYFATQVGLMTGLYLVAMNGGASVGVVLTATWVEAGASWRLPLGVLALPALVAALVWRARLRTVEAVQPATTAPSALWRDPLTWQITAYIGLQSSAFYAIVSWLPSILTDAGLKPAAAGAQLALLTVIGVPAALLTPLLAVRLADQRLLAMGLALITASGFTGMAVWPGVMSSLWSSLIGIGLGAAFSLSMTLIVLRSRDPQQAASLSGFAQSGGYLLAASAPILVGALRDTSGGWESALWLLVGLAIAQALFGLAAGRDRYVGPQAPHPERLAEAEWAAIAATAAAADKATGDDLDS